eukprot:2836003-Prymnesium_polylepis.1
MSLNAQANVTRHLQTHGMAVSSQGRMDIEWSRSNTTGIGLPGVAQGHPRKAKLKRGAGGVRQGSRRRGREK